MVIVGQTPPPYHGQSIMIAKIATFDYPGIPFELVRMSFSEDIDSVGKFRIRKMFELAKVIVGIYKARLKGANLLYYPPAGPNLVPVIRDIVILLSTRFLFKHIIFHFHAGGISEYYQNMPHWTRWLFRKAYFYPSLSIRLSARNPEDGKFLQSRQEVIIPYGIDDELYDPPPATSNGGPLKILFAGVLKVSKGIVDLIKAAAEMKEKGFSDFVVLVMGKPESDTMAKYLEEVVTKNGLEGNVRFLGVKTGKEKINVFNEADIFCFPSYYESETFGIVLVEAMRAGKPVVSTYWRGIPDVVEDGKNGVLVPIQNPSAIAAALLKLAEDPHLRSLMGQHGRSIYLQKFTTAAFKARFYQAINCVVEY